MVCACIVHTQRILCAYGAMDEETIRLNEMEEDIGLGEPKHIYE